jgi:hypothetical protein
MAPCSQVSIEVTFLGLRRAAKDSQNSAAKQKELSPDAVFQRAFDRECSAVEHFVVRPGPRLPLTLSRLSR